MKKNVLTISLLLIMITGNLMAKDTAKLGLEECLKIGLKNNKEYLAAKKSVESAIASKKAAFASFMYPSINFNGGYTYIDKDTAEGSAMTIPAGALGPSAPAVTFPQAVYQHNIKLGLGATYAIPFIPFLSDGAWGAARKGYQLTKKQLGIAKSKLKQIKINTIAAILKSYYALLLSQESYKLTLANQKRLEAYLTVAKRNYNSGRISRYELLRARVQVLNNSPKLLNAKHNFKLAKIVLLKTLSLNLDKDISLSGALKTARIKIDEKNALKKGLSNSVDIKQIDLSINILELTKDLNKASSRPAFVAFANWETAYNNGSKEFSDNWNFGLQLSIPLSEMMPWSKTKKTVKSTQKSIEGIKISKQSLVEGLKLQIKQALLKLDENSKTIDAQKSSISLSKEGLKIAKIRYYNGQMGNVELMDAELGFQQSQLLLYLAWFNYISAKVDLKTAMGTLTGDSFTK